MNNTFENEIEEKTLKCLLVRALHNNTGLNLGLSIYVKNLVSVFMYSLSIKVALLLKWSEEIFLYFFCKIKSIRVLIIPSFVPNFKTYLQIQTLILIGNSSQPLSDKFLRFPLKISSLEFHSFVQSAREISRTSQKQKKLLLICSNFVLMM